MPSGFSATPDPEDMFSDTRMSFGDHIEDLRIHLIRAGFGFILGMIVAFFISKYVLEIISKPVQRELIEYQKRTVGAKLINLQEALTEAKGKLPPFRFTQKIDVRPLMPFIRDELNLPVKAEQINFEPWLREFEDLFRDLGMHPQLNREGLKQDYWVEVPVQIADLESYLKALQALKPYYDPPSMKTFTIMETFMVYFKVSIITGFILSSPWVFYQVWAFIAAGLYPHEKKLVHYYLPFSLGLFLAGVVLCQIFVIPKAIEALLWFNEWLGFEPELRLSDWLGFAIMMPVVFGISFQTPLVMMFVNRIGLIDVKIFRSNRRIAWFIMAIFAAVITPTVDAVSMLFLWVPMGFLYELGILLCVWQNRNPFDDSNTTPSQELIEV